MSSPTATSCISGLIPDAEQTGSSRPSASFFCNHQRKTWTRGCPAMAGHDDLRQNENETRLIHLPLVADRAKMLVDAKHDQNEFRSDARKHDSDEYPGDRGQ